MSPAVPGGRSPRSLHTVSKPTAQSRRIVNGMNTSLHRTNRGRPAFRAARDGARSMAPWLAGIAPLGFVLGVTTARADIPTGARWLAGPLIFSASGQAVTVQLLDRHAAALVVIAGGISVNLRLVLYSGAMARYWRGRPTWWNALAAYTLVDPSAAVALEAYQRSDDPAYGDAHYVGAAATLAIAWFGSLALGATVGAGLPRGLQLEFVIPLYLAGQLVQRVDDATAKRAVVAAIALALVSITAPLHLGTLIAITGGTLVAIKIGDGPR